MAYATRKLSLARPTLTGAGLTRSVRSAGKLVAAFSTTLWTVQGTPAVAPTLTDHTGFDSNGVRTGIVSRTGQSNMLKWEPGAGTASVQVALATPATNILTPALAGKIGLWVYVDTQPGYDSTQTPLGSIAITLCTATGTTANALSINFNINQVREGWNFLKFVQRNPLAYLASSTGVVEYHPFGIAATGGGTGAQTNIVADSVAQVRIDVVNFAGSTLYFDSLWTGFNTQAQIVLGTDSGGTDLATHALPIFQSKGWVGYTAVPSRPWASGSKQVIDLTADLPSVNACYAAGWDNINHTANHLANGGLTSPAEIAYEVEAVKGLYASNGLIRGSEFYASPQSSSSRLAEKVIREAGFVAQRHARKTNVCVTPWGVDNLHHIGASDISSGTSGGIAKVTAGVPGADNGWQTFTKIRRMVDVIEAYGDTWFPFWHSITVAGDTDPTGETAPTTGATGIVSGDINLYMFKTTFQLVMDYIATREAAGGLRVRDGFTGWYYGVGR